MPCSTRANERNANADSSLESWRHCTAARADAIRLECRKIRGAAELAVYRADPQRRASHGRALAHFNQAVSDWEAYARSATSQYNPQLFSRTHYMDWWKTLEDVKQEAESVRKE